MTSVRRIVFGLAVFGLTTPVFAQAEPPFPGPNFLECEVGADNTTNRNSVHLRWDVLDVPAELSRDGQIIARIPADELSFVDENVPAGDHVYTLAVATATGILHSVSCAVTVGGTTSPVLCSVDGDVVTVSWDVLPGIPIFGFAISRDGVLIRTAGPDERSLRDEPGAGRHTYTVSTNNRLPPPKPDDPNDPAGGQDVPDFLIGSCVAVVEADPPDSRLDCDVSADGTVHLRW